jgi:hypothetical protein
VSQILFEDLAILLLYDEVANAWFVFRAREVWARLSDLGRKQIARLCDLQCNAANLTTDGDRFSEEVVQAI